MSSAQQEYEKEQGPKWSLGESRAAYEQNNPQHFAQTKLESGCNHIFVAYTKGTWLVCYVDRKILPDLIGGFFGFFFFKPLRRIMRSSQVGTSMALMIWSGLSCPNFSMQMDCWDFWSMKFCSSILKSSNLCVVCLFFLVRMSQLGWKMHKMLHNWHYAFSHLKKEQKK